MTPHPPRPAPYPDQSDASYTSDTAFLASVLAASRDCIKVLDLDGNLLFMTPAGRTLMEVADFEALRLCSWDQFWPAPATPDARAALAAAQAGGTGRFAAVRNSFAGNPRFWEVEVRPIAGPDGRPARLLAISRDRTDQRRAQAIQHDQSIELNHRIKNQMAVVQSIVNQTLRGAYPLDTAKKMIAARLDVLARTHDLLMHSAGERASVHAIVDTATQLLDRRRINISGSDIVVGSKPALSLALMLHELSTNAVTHGAFSVPHGRVAISWGHGQMDGEPAFELSFVESDGPAVSPPAARGFGCRLLQGGLSGSASRATLDFHPQGLQFRLVAVVEGDAPEAGQKTLG